MRLILFSLLGLAALSAVLAANTLRLPALSPEPPAIDTAAIDEQAAAGRLAEALRIATVSTAGGQPADPATFAAFAEMLQRQFPNAHRVMHRERIADGSLLYTWAGQDSTRKPVLLLAHMDVVPGSSRRSGA